MEREPLTLTVFLQGAEMIQQQLRIKEADRWSPDICKLKFFSFCSEFPEVDRTQFLWACEKWLQALTPGFVTFPVWAELMAPLYGCEAGRANRSYGFKSDLPGFLRPTPEQLAQLPAVPITIFPNPDRLPLLGAAASATPPKALPPAAAPSAELSDETWEAYLKGEDISPPAPPPPPAPAVKRIALPLLSREELARAEEAVLKARKS
jgi:hypothetical protein